MVAKACQKAEPNAALARCLPLQKQQMARCGGVYSKAYSSCWHGYDSASSNDPTAVSPSELQTEIAVRRCGLAYAKSTLLCQHRSSLYQREAGLFPEKSTLLQVKRARACQAIHRKGQSSCSHAWSQTDPLEQTRDAAVRQQLDGTASPVFWPGFVATVLHGKDPAPPTNQKQAQASYGDATALRAMLKMAEEIKRQADVPLPPPTPSVLAPPTTTTTTTITTAGLPTRVDAGQLELLAVGGTENHPMPPPPAQTRATQETHPLTVAMDECRKLQMTAAHACLNTDASHCNLAFGTAYTSCFDRFQQAKGMLVRAKRMPEQLTRQEAERKAIKAQLEAEAALPPELQEEARMTCARAYTAYSAKCQTAHGHAGALCRKFATRREVDPDSSTLDRCGSDRSQARTVCDQELGRGRRDCEKAWFKIKAMAQGQDVKPTAVMNPSQLGYENNRDYTVGPPLLSMLSMLNGHRTPAVSSLHAQLREAKATIVRKKTVSQRLLGEAQALGLQSVNQRNKAAAALVELFGLEGVAHSLSAMIIDEKAQTGLLRQPNSTGDELLLVPPLPAKKVTVEEPHKVGNEEKWVEKVEKKPPQMAIIKLDANGIPDVPGMTKDLTALIQATKVIQGKVDRLSGPHAKALATPPAGP